MTAYILTPKHMLIGGGARKNLAALLGDLGLSKPLIVTDPLLVKLGKVDELQEILTTAGILSDIFSDTVPDPTDLVIEAGVTCLRDGNYDCLIALGGGSPIDTAKAIALLHKGGGRIRDYKVPHVVRTIGLPIIAIPTTAGTGSEVTRFTIITDSASDEKMLISGPGCLPVAAIVDYELTYSVPFRTTADTGIDSLTHAIEAYVSRKANLYSDIFAKSAITRISKYLRLACLEPDNSEAREQMMLGALEGGIAFSNASVALVHGMSRPLGAFFHVPHGLSNAMLLPAVTAFSADAAEARYADCARFAGAADDACTDERAVVQLVGFLRALNQDLKVPSPREYGIDPVRYRSLLPVMAEQALASGSPGNNPRVPLGADIIALYEEILG